MTEQELRFVLSAQDEGLRRGIEAAEKAVEGLDAAVLQLAGTQLKYNTAAQWFVDNSGRYVAQEKALAQAGIITSKQLTEQIRLLDQLIVQEQRDAVVTQQLIQRKEALQRQYGLLDAAQVKSGARLRSNTQLYFQAGQAISDFAVAGIRGAANNIEFLAASLGASAPLLIGISVASAAFFVFGDDIVKALSPISTQAKETEQAISDMLKVISVERPDLAILEEQLPAAIDENKNKIRELEQEIRGSSYLSAILGTLNGLSPVIGDIPVGLLDGILGTKEETKRLGQLKGELTDFEGRLEDIRRNDEAAGSLAQNSVLQTNLLKIETIKLDLDLAGLAEERAGYTNDQLLAMNKEIGYEGILKKLQGERTESKRTELSEIQKLIDQNQDLTGVLDGIRSGERDRIEDLRIQNKLLDDQVRQAQRILELRVAAGGSVTSDLAIQGLQRAVTSDQQALPGLQSTQDLLANLDSGLRGTDVLGQLDSLSAENMARMKEDVRELTQLNEQLTQSIQSGLAGAFSDLAGSIGEALVSTEGFQGFGANILKSLGGFAQQFGATLIAFGTSGLAIQTFVTNPVGAIIAGGALVALGGVLKGTAQKQLDAFNKGNGVSSPVSSVTALGFRQSSEAFSRGALLPVGTRSSRGALQVEVIATESYTPAGDRVRSFRQALATESKKGGKGTL